MRMEKEVDEREELFLPRTHLLFLFPLSLSEGKRRRKERKKDKEKERKKEKERERDEREKERNKWKKGEKEREILFLNQFTFETSPNKFKEFICTTQEKFVVH